MGVVTYPTLEHVAMEARPYPTDILESAETGLCLFAAAFLGHNDAIHFAEAGLLSMCIDTDKERLDAMRSLYPKDWDFVAADAWTFANAAVEMEAMWDVVSVDTFTGDAMRRALGSLELWCSLARRAVTVTYQERQVVNVPKGFVHDFYNRAGDIYWLVLRRL